MSKRRRIRLFHLDRFGRRMEESLDEEVRFHLEARIEESVKRGRSPEEARAEALAQFGDPELMAVEALLGRLAVEKDPRVREELSLASGGRG